MRVSSHSCGEPELRSALTIWMLVSTTVIAFAGESMNVVVCNLSQVPGPLVEHAQAEAAYVFRAIHVEVHWMDCGAEAGITPPRPDYIVRVQFGGKISKACPISLDAMGRAFMDSAGYGFMVDTYFGAIHDLTLRFPLAGSSQLLGFVITHELGHLLIGPGHRPNGIVRASWGKQELEALNRGRLKFSDWERAAILCRLAARNTPSVSVPAH